MQLKFPWQGFSAARVTLYYWIQLEKEIQWLLACGWCLWDICCQFGFVIVASCIVPVDGHRRLTGSMNLLLKRKQQ